MRSPTLRELPPPPPGKTGWPWTEATPSAPERMPDGRCWPRISIVTPSYNQGQFIEETIRTVLLQGYPDLEYIVIDGGSSDSSVEVIRRYQDWLTYWVSEKDDGQTHAINKGFAKASGDIFAYLNSDDLFTVQALQVVAQEYQKNKSDNLIMTFAGVEFGNYGDEKIVYTEKAPRITTWLSQSSSLFQQSTFWSSSLHRAVKGFDESLHFCFDKDFFLQCIFKEGIFLSKPEYITSKFRFHPDSKTSTIYDICLAENNLIFEKYRKIPHYSSLLEIELEAQAVQSRIISSMNLDSRFLAFKSMLLIPFRHSLRSNWRFYFGALRRVIFKAYQ